MTLESNKILGGIGAILMLIGIFPHVSFYGIVELVGAILILVSLYGLSSYYRDSTIFRNALYGIITGIVGVVIAVAIAFTVIFANISSLLYELFPGWTGDIGSLQNITPDPNAFLNFDLSSFLPLIIGAIAVLVIVWVSAIIATFFIWRSFKHVSAKSTVGLFGTAGLLLLIGAFLAIIAIGFILMWIAALLLAIAFFQLKPGPIEAVPPPPTPV
jgi:uncharacterized membrane protein